MSSFDRRHINDRFGHMHRRARHSVSMLVVYICTAVFLLITLAGVAGLVRPNTLIATLGLSSNGIQKGWLFEFVTSPFIHHGLGHLVFNMLALWMLGPGVEEVLGKKRYIVLSAVSALSAMTAFLLVNLNTGHAVVGYSAVIFGILVAQARFFPESRIALFAFFPVKMKYAVLLMGAVELYMTIIPGQSAVSHISHLFGAAGAYVYLSLQQRRAARADRRSSLWSKTPKPVAAVKKARAAAKIPRKL